MPKRPDRSCPPSSCIGPQSFVSRSVRRRVVWGGAVVWLCRECRGRVRLRKTTSWSHTRATARAHRRTLLSHPRLARPCSLALSVKSRVKRPTHGLVLHRTERGALPWPLPSPPNINHVHESPLHHTRHQRRGCCPCRARALRLLSRLRKVTRYPSSSSRHRSPTVSTPASAPAPSSACLPQVLMTALSTAWHVH